jgi:hypothetical protein
MYCPIRNRNSSVSIVTRLRTGHWGWITCKYKDFSLSHRVQIGTRAHTTSCPVGTVGVCAPERKRPERETDTYLQVVPRIRMRGSIPPLPHTSSLLGVYLTLRDEHLMQFCM